MSRCRSPGPAPERTDACSPRMGAGFIKDCHELPKQGMEGYSRTRTQEWERDPTTTQEGLGRQVAGMEGRLCHIEKPGWRLQDAGARTTAHREQSRPSLLSTRSAVERPLATILIFPTSHCCSRWAKDAATYTHTLSLIPAGKRDSCVEHLLYARHYARFSIHIITLSPQDNAASCCLPSGHSEKSSCSFKVTLVGRGQGGSVCKLCTAQGADLLPRRLRRDLYDTDAAFVMHSLSPGDRELSLGEE